MSVSWGFVPVRAGGGCTLQVRGISRAPGGGRGTQRTAGQRPSFVVFSGAGRAKSALVPGIYGLPHLVLPRNGALFAMQHNNEWDRALKITADGRGLIGHAGAVLLRKAVHQAGLTAQLSRAMRVTGSSPLLDRGIVLVSVAVAIALGATSMSDIVLLAHLAPLLGTAASGPTVRRALDLAGDRRTRDRIARARARARSRAWDLVWQASCGFPWLEVAGKTLTGWVVIDMDATLITAHSEKENAAPTWKKGYGLPSPRGLVPQHPRVPGHEAAPRQRRVEHVHRPPGGPHRRDPPGPGHPPTEDAGPRRWRRSQPRPHQPPPVAVVPAPHHAVHLRLDHPPRRRRRHPDAARECVEAGHLPGRHHRDGQGGRRDHAPDEPGGELARRPAVDRPPGQAVPAAAREAHSL